MVEEVGEVVTMPEQEVRQPTIEAVTSSVEVATPLVSVSLASFFLYLDLYILICLLTCNPFFRLQPCSRVLETLTNFLKMSL
jgi:hypothetical protein